MRDSSIDEIAYRTVRERSHCLNELRGIDNVVVNHYLGGWLNGSFASLEHCLTALAIELAKRNKELVDQLIRAATLAPPNPIIVAAPSE